MATTFGKRGRFEAPPPPPPPRRQSGAGGSGDGPGPAASLAREALLFAACTFLALVVINTHMRLAHRLMGVWIESRWDAVVSRPDFGQVPTPTFFFDTGEEMNARSARIHAACERSSARSPIDSLFADAPDASPLAGERSLQRSAAYLDCYMRTEPERFRDTSNRADLAEKIREHITVMARVRDEWRYDLSVDINWRPTGHENPLLQAWSMMLKPPDPETLDYPSSVFDPRIVAALQDLKSCGYISRSDFGWGWLGIGAPKEVSNALRGVSASPSACAL